MKNKGNISDLLSHLKKSNFNDFISHKTLLYGDTDTKKTFYTAKFIQFLIETKKVSPKDISVLDFAPKLKVIQNVRIGGKIEEFYKNSITCNNITFEGNIIPPRLNARNKAELYEIACNNFQKTKKVLKIFNENPTSILIINDISLYLHIGSIKLLLESINRSDTFFGNTYYGTSIKSDFSTLFSLREIRLVKYLIKKIEFSYFTG
ncbi:MAG: hypothetical protein ACFFB0_21425 [Promethearchaeota archaeon]